MLEPRERANTSPQPFPFTQSNNRVLNKNIEFEDNAPRRKYLVKPYGIDANSPKIVIEPKYLVKHSCFSFLYPTIPADWYGIFSKLAKVTKDLGSPWNENICTTSLMNIAHPKCTLIIDI